MMTPDEISLTLTEAEQYLTAAEHLLVEAKPAALDASMLGALYAGSCAHSLLAIGRLLKAGLEDEA